MSTGVLTEIDTGVGIITLDLPEPEQTLDTAQVEALDEALAGMGGDPAVRVVVLSATGSHFCLGGPQADPLAQASLLSTLDALPKPVLARVQGPAAELGLGLVAACDIVVASFDAQFGCGEVQRGQVPALIAPYLAAAVGLKVARRYLLTGERFSAAEAYRLGLVSELVPDAEDLDTVLGELVDQLLLGAPQAQAGCKRALQGLGCVPTDEATLEHTVEVARAGLVSAEAEEARRARAEHRRPSWALTASGP